MYRRRRFLSLIPPAIIGLSPLNAVVTKVPQNIADAEMDNRTCWISILVKIADPVLQTLSSVRTETPIFFEKI